MLKGQILLPCVCAFLPALEEHFVDAAECRLVKGLMVLNIFWIKHGSIGNVCVLLHKDVEVQNRERLKERGGCPLLRCLIFWWYCGHFCNFRVMMEWPEESSSGQKREDGI